MSDAFTLASWNIFQGMHHRSIGRRWETNHALRDEVAALDSDVLVLPECWKFKTPGDSWTMKLAEELGYELHQWVSVVPSLGRYVAPWRMVIMTRIPARRLPDHVLPGLAPYGGRAVVRVELVESGLVLAGLHLHGVHLLRRGRVGNWMRERAELRKTTASSDIVAGDFNMWGPVVALDHGPLRSVVRGRTWPAPRPHSQIDHLLVSHRVDVVDSRVLTGFGSDHRPLIATLRPHR